MRRMKMQCHRKSGLGLIAACCAAMAGCNPQYEVAQRPNMERALALRDALGGGATGGAEAADAGPKAQPTGWTTLKGHIAYEGTPPARQPLNVTADLSVCAAGGAPLEQSLVVGPDGGIQDVLIYVNTSLPTEEPWTHPSAMPGGEPVEFDQKKCIFLSHVFACRVGQTVKILNSDPVGHNTNLQPKANAPMNQIVAAGSSIDWTPTGEEKSTFPVSCSIHPHMKAYMIVRGNGYFAVTDEKGNFEIPNLPAGIELEFRVWQEKSGWIDGVSIDGKPVKKGKVAVKLDPGEKQWDVKLGEAVFN